MYNYVNGVNSLSANIHVAGSGVGCTRSLNNAPLDSRTQFSRDAEAPRTRRAIRKIPVISQREHSAQRLHNKRAFRMRISQCSPDELCSRNVDKGHTRICKRIICNVRSIHTRSIKRMCVALVTIVFTSLTFLVFWYLCKSRC